jgi:hypothetical protein
MTRTTRLRRTILQLRQIFLTDAITFICVLLVSRAGAQRTGNPPLKFALRSRLSYW